MIRQNDFQRSVADKFSFAVFCLSATASAIGYGIWGFPGLLVSPVFAAVAFLSSPKSAAKPFATSMACLLGVCAFAISSAIREESDEASIERFFRMERASGSVVSAEVTSTRSSGFDARILSVGGMPFEEGLEIRFYAAVDRLSPGDEVEITERKKISATGRKTTIPEMRADVVTIANPRPGAISGARVWLGGLTDRLFPRKEAGLAKGILF
ncbi:MAG: hypothetical protein QMC36_07115 [Patescibacteria group bacterium]